MVRVASQRRARRVPRSGTPWVPRRSALGGGFEATVGGLHPSTKPRVSTFFQLEISKLSHQHLAAIRLD